MNLDEIIDLARQAVGDYSRDKYWAFFTEDLERFAALVESRTASISAALLQSKDAQIAELQSELTEQARCNGAGAERELALQAKVEALNAARWAYASEFQPNADGDPDVGGIHANIRTLKAQAEALRADAARLDFMCNKPARFIDVEGGWWRLYEDVAPPEEPHAQWRAIVTKYEQTPREAIDAAIQARAAASIGAKEGDTHAD